MRKTCIKREVKDIKFTELKIKENITPDIIAEAIEYISNSCFIGGTYNPYYRSFSEKMAIVQFFLDGIEFEDGDSLFAICELDEVKKLTAKFYGDKRINEYSPIMEVVNHNVDEIVEFKKQRLIHGVDAIESIAKNIEDITGRLNEFGNFISDLDVALGNILKLDFNAINEEDIENARKLADKFANGDMAKALKEAANFDIDKASQEVIDAKNKQIEELKRRNKEFEAKHNARNVLAFKKEVDG